MNILEINPYIRLALRSELPAPFVINRRVILDYELIYGEDGEFTLVYNEHSYGCKRNDLLLICPGISHSFHVPDVDVKQPHIHFDMKYDFQSEQVFICYKDLPALTPAEKSMLRENIFPQLADSPFLKISCREDFLKIFYEILDKNTPDMVLRQKVNILRLLEMIMAENGPSNRYSPTNTMKIASFIKSYIQSNYNQKISLDVLSRQFGYSKFYIEKVFRKAYGISVINYRNKKRIEAATQLLEKYSVSETAQMLGFSSIYSFSRAFHSATGLPPSRYSSNEDTPPHSF